MVVYVAFAPDDYSQLIEPQKVFNSKEKAISYLIDLILNNSITKENALREFQEDMEENCNTNMTFNDYLKDCLESDIYTDYYYKDYDVE